MNDFEEYIRQSEPHKREKGYAWQTAIGLQAVDGLKPSEYLKEKARQHIEGDITIDEVKQIEGIYYEEKSSLQHYYYHAGTYQLHNRREFLYVELLLDAECQNIV